MAYRTISDLNTSEGPHVILQAAAEAVPFIGGLILFALFIIVLFGTFFSSKRLTGRGNFPASFATAGVVTAIVSVIMSLIPNFINNTIVVISVSIAIIGVIFLFTTKE